ncbi:MAG: beta-xylosidase [Candidatus Binatia bacterium]
MLGRSAKDRDRRGARSARPSPCRLFAGQPCVDGRGVGFDVPAKPRQSGSNTETTPHQHWRDNAEQNTEQMSWRFEELPSGPGAPPRSSELRPSYRSVPVRSEIPMGEVHFQCDLGAATVPLTHFWEHTVGSGHAPLALRADWQAQLRRCHHELGFRHVRFHGLLSDAMGTLICHRDALLYSFFNIDQIWDFLLTIGMKPFIELSFMPQVLASGPETVFRYRGNVTPPKDYAAWSILVRLLTQHWVDRYGIEEVRTWLFEVWNEPNLHHFWTGKQEDYFRLYRHTVEAIKGVDARLRVGGPATAKNAWIEEFVAFCDAQRLPADFVSTHQYPTDVVEGTSLGDEEDITEAQLVQSPRSILRTWTREVQRQAQGRPVYYTEWNTSSNPRDPRHDDPYAAAVVTKTIMEANGLVEGYSFWTFSDIFAENYYPSIPFHGGFGLLNLHGIAKPTYRAFELLHRLGTELLPVEGGHATVDAWIVRGAGSITILLTNHALPRHAIATEPVHIQLREAAPPVAAFVERIDEDHANAKRAWHAMGEPTYPSALEVERLKAASETVQVPHPWTYEAGTIHLDIEMPPHAVASVTLELAPA